ncbi:MAG: N-acetylmuramoyl-L-alanine amidase [Anaerolineae bacterium]
MSRQGTGRSVLTIGLFVVVAVLGVTLVTWLRADPQADTVTPTTIADAPTATMMPSPTPVPTSTPQPTPTDQPIPTPTTIPRPPKIGIVAGHWQSDSGAICDDGLQEVSINTDIAAQVVAILQSKGYDAELLPEFSDKLAGYKAAAFVSIHSDACNVPEASGFKVARVSGSAIPEVEDRLVTCLIQEYGRTTGLPFHRNSITYDMTVYHAFNEIDPQTPGAIIELGFMGADRQILTEGAHTVALGVTRGIECFLNE